jgi:phage terminase large subunit-like protein
MSGNNILTNNGISASELTPIEILERALARKKSNRIGKFFPDTGPLRRELYPKHMEFLAAGKEHDERLFLAANKCISPWTPIEQTGSSTRQCIEFLSAPSFDVRSWDGSSRCSKRASGVFLKGIEPMFHLQLDNGQWLQTTRRHRVLTTVGWISLAQLIHASDGLRCRQTAPGYPANYAVDDRRYDELLQGLSGFDPARLPSTDDAHKHKPTAYYSDAAARSLQHSRAYPESVHRPILDDVSQILGLCGDYPDPTPQLFDQWSISQLRDLWQFAQSYTRRPAFDESGNHCTFSEPSLKIEYRDVCKTRSIVSSSQPASERSQSLDAHFREVEGFLQSDPLTEIFVPYSSPSLVGGQKIIAIIPVGSQPVLDFSVESTQAYESGGLISHNTGKTLTGGLETAFHATGLYPPWWQGRVFEQPTNGWVCNNTAIDVRDINQQVLMGDPGQYGTGLIPKDLIIDYKSKSSVPDGLELIYVRHVTGGQSVITTKAYEQGRPKFQGRNIHYIWADEEIPADVYGESILRLMTTKGIMYCTYTPVLGLTPITVKFLRESVNKDQLPFKFDSKVA